MDWQYPVYHSVEWEKEEKESQDVFFPSFHLTWQIQTMGFVRQIVKIARCAVDMFCQMFRLSMCLCDAYLLCNDDPHIRYEACTELVAEGDQYQSQLKENQKWLIEEIEKGSELADRILLQLELENDSSTIISQLKEFAEGAEDILDDLYNVAEETVDTVYVKGKITLLKFIGLAPTYKFLLLN